MILIFLFLCVYFSLCDVLQIQFISRHCDRTPKVFFDFPYEPIDEKKLHLGALTNLGLHHCYELGEWIQNQFIGNTSFDPIVKLPQKFNSNDYAFFSSSMNRAIRSSYASSMGYFPQGSSSSPTYHPMDPKEKYETFLSLPNGTTPIGVSVYKWQNDVYIRAYDKCTNVTDLDEDFLNSGTFIDFQTKNQKLWKNITETLGYGVDHNPSPPSISMILDVASQVIFMETSGLLKNISFSSEVWNKWMDAADEYWVINSNYIYTDYGIGFLLGDIKSKIEDYLQFDLGDSDSTAKFVQYSGHDSTIGSAFTALKIYENNTEARIWPGLGSAFFIVLREGPKPNGTGPVNSTDHVKRVELYFKKSFDGEFVELFLKGQKYPLPVEDFIQYLEDHQTTDWCEVCQVDMKLENKCDVCIEDDVKDYRGYNTAAEIYMGVLISLMIVIAGMIILCYITQTMSKVNQRKELRDLHQNVMELSESVNFD